MFFWIGVANWKSNAIGVMFHWFRNNVDNACHDHLV